MVQPEGEYTERSGGLCGVVESAELGSVALPAPLHSELYARLFSLVRAGWPPPPPPSLPRE